MPRVAEKPALQYCCAAVLWLASIMAAVSGASAQDQSFSGPLDGMRFNASIVRTEGDTTPPPLIDMLVFDGGTFTSHICERYNFTPAVYWVRHEGKAIHFQAQLVSPTDGQMLWQARIEDGVLRGTMRWTRSRWYWTIDVTHEISGTLDTAETPQPAGGN